MKRKAREVFSPLLVIALVAVGLVAMIGSLLAASFRPDDGSRLTARANVFSDSGIGHRVLAESLKKQGIAPLISQYRTEGRLQQNALLLLLEPRISAKEPEQFTRLLSHDKLILSLPKWTGGADPLNPRWLGRAHLTPTAVPQKILKVLDSDAELVRPFARQKKGVPADEEAAPEEDRKKDGPKTIVINTGNDNSLEEPELVRPIVWTTNLLGYTPTLVNPQLIRSDKIVPIVASEEGILIGSLDPNGAKLVLADPDILSNAGIGRGENAKLAFAMLSLLMDGDSAVVIDETTHGFVRNPDILRAAFEYPFVIVTLQIIIFSAFLVWTTTQRFGAARKQPSTHRTSKTVLIQNMASLMQKGEHQPEVLEKHIEFTWRSMARKLRVPRNLDDVSTIAWLDDLGRKKGVHMLLETIRHRAKMLNGKRGEKASFLDVVHEKPLQQIILHLEQWEREMLDGS